MLVIVKFKDLDKVSPYLAIAQNIQTFDCIVETDVNGVGEIVETIPINFIRLCFDSLKNKYGLCEYISYEKYLYVKLKEELYKIEEWYNKNNYKCFKVFNGENQKAMGIEVTNGHWLKEDNRYIEYIQEYSEKHIRAEELKLEIENLITQPMLKKKKR